MTSPLVPGLTQTVSLQVNEAAVTTAFTPHFSAFADLPPVFTTAFLAGFVEWACIEALKPCLEEGQHTMGTHVYLSHIAPTPLGRKITAQVELIEMQGRALRFRVDCYDACDLIASGVHERTLIDTVFFRSREGSRPETSHPLESVGSGANLAL